MHRKRGGPKICLCLIHVCCQLESTEQCFSFSYSCTNSTNTFEHLLCANYCAILGDTIMKNKEVNAAFVESYALFTLCSKLLWCINKNK
jgi:hypothetical protein